MILQVITHSDIRSKTSLDFCLSSALSLATAQSYLLCVCEQTQTVPSAVISTRTFKFEGSPSKKYAGFCDLTPTQKPFWAYFMKKYWKMFQSERSFRASKRCPLRKWRKRSRAEPCTHKLLLASAHTSSRLRAGSATTMA